MNNIKNLENENIKLREELSKVVCELEEKKQFIKQYDNAMKQKIDFIKKDYEEKLTNITELKGMSTCLYKYITKHYEKASLLDVETELEKFIEINKMIYKIGG